MAQTTRLASFGHVLIMSTLHLSPITYLVAYNHYTIVISVKKCE